MKDVNRNVMAFIKFHSLYADNKLGEVILKSAMQLYVRTLVPNMFPTVVCLFPTG